ncbi:uncharacterized protein LOC142350780 [Convolutriloba macropyga]|uniref:uncharacterized protein LOC142350780 n=1 Tax=Convolutriloba macropyga TaxID=536237 RepID=UPI003F524F5D
MKNKKEIILNFPPGFDMATLFDVVQPFLQINEINNYACGVFKKLVAVFRKGSYVPDIQSRLCGAVFDLMMKDTIEHMLRQRTKDVMFNQEQLTSTNLTASNVYYSNLSYFLKFPLENIWKIIGDYNFRNLLMNASLFYVSNSNGLLIQLTGNSLAEAAYAKKLTFKSSKSTKSSMHCYPIGQCKIANSYSNYKKYPNIWRNDFIVNFRNVETLSSNIFDITPSKNGKLFMGKHLRKFPAVLKNILRSLKCLKFEKRVVSSFDLFLQKMLSISLEVCGSKRNKESMVAWFTNYFKLGRYDSIDFTPLIRELWLGDLKWLSNVDMMNKRSREKAEQYVISLFEWLLFGVILPKVPSLFQIEFDPKNGLLRPFRKNRHICDQLEALQVFTGKPLEIYQHAKSSDIDKLMANNKVLGISKLKFCRKPNGEFRPIVKHGERIRSDWQSVNERLLIVSQLFRFLVHSNHQSLSGGLSLEPGARDKIVCKRMRNFFNTQFKKSVYYVKADMEKCYDNIDQNIMCGIINQLFDQLKHEKFVYQRLSLLCEKRPSKIEKLCRKNSGKRYSHYVKFTKIIRNLSQSFPDIEDTLELLAHQIKKVNNTAKVCELKKLENDTINVDELRKQCLLLVKRNVLKCAWSKDCFLWQQRGLSQGANISSFLSYLYLNEIDKKFLVSQFNDKGLLMRNVDDYLFVTTDYHQAKMFADRFLLGFQEFNLKANPNKVQVFCSNGETDTFCWCGVCFNVKTGDVSPNYAALDERKPSVILGRSCAKLVRARLNAVVKCYVRWSYYAEGFTSQCTWERNVDGLIRSLFLRLKYMLQFVPSKQRNHLFTSISGFFLQIGQNLCRRCRISKQSNMAVVNFTERLVREALLKHVFLIESIVNVDPLVTVVFGML